MIQTIRKVHFRWSELIFELEGMSEEGTIFEFSVTFADGSTSRRSAMVSGNRFLTIDISDYFKPIIGVDVRSENLRFCNELEGVFKKSFPVDDREYESNFIRKVQRIPGASFQYFSALQISQYFSGNKNYRLSAVVVLCYKAVEIGDDLLIAKAKKICLDAISTPGPVELDWHPRRNSEHLSASLLCALYHVALAEGDKDSFLESLNSSLELVDKTSNFFTPSYPIGLAGLLLVLVNLRNNRIADAEDLVHVLEGIFKSAVRDSLVDRLTLFEELKVTHQSVVLAKKAIRGSIPMKEAFMHAIRVKGRRAEELFRTFEKIIC